jgi:hypothetical protein
MNRLIISAIIAKFFFNWRNFVLSLFFFLCLNGFSQNSTIEYNNESIRSVQIFKKGWVFSNPVIQLGSSDVLLLSFDELGQPVKDYYYSFQLCDASWNDSGLMEMDFVDGYNRFRIDNYSYSFNTTFDYVHYEVEIPASKVLRSGNYRVILYEGAGSDTPVLSVPFYVYEPLVTVVPRIKYTTSSDYKMMQEVDFVVKHPNLAISNPQTEVKVVVSQNGRIDNRISHLRPLFVRHNELVYDYSRENEFEGGNEFRWLDIRSTRFWPQNVREVQFFDPYYHFVLQNDEWGDKLTYLFREDFNGKYYLERKEGGDASVEADYVYVHFSLPMINPFKGGDIHVLGGLTNWKLDESSKMRYNEQSRCYELSLLLKQGFYNYQYALKPPVGQASVTPLENSFGQTENDYMILVYYKGFADRCDRLVGVNMSNSLKNTSALPF